MKKLLVIFSILFIHFNNNLFSQTSKIDSLQNLLNKTTVDTSKAVLTAKLAFEYKFTDPEKSKKMAEQALMLAKKSKHTSSEALSNNIIGIYYYLQQDSKTAKEYYLKSLELYQTINHSEGIASCYSNIANIFTDIAVFDSAIFYQTQALKFRLKTNKEESIAYSYTNLGNIYNLKGDYSLSIENTFKAIKIFEKLKHSYGLSICFYNLARTYYMQKSYDNALNYSQKSREEAEKTKNMTAVGNSYILDANVFLSQEKSEAATKSINTAIEIQTASNDINGLMYSYSLLGSVFLSYKQYDLAIEYYLKGRDLSEKTGNKMALVSSDYNLGIIYLEKGDFKNAVEHSQSALKLAKEINSKEEIKNSYEGLVKVYTKMKQFDKALEYQTLYINMKDSLLNETNSKQLNELQTQYDTEKKQKEIELLTKDQEVKNERIARQNIITYTIVAGLVLVIILAFISFKRYREKKKANIEITHQKEIIEIKNKEILDSIHYAKRIQRALLASDQLLNNNLPEHFVLYKPKDIVSGDFYWAQQTSNNHFLLATCDCTGHGVPGAFMSLLNISKLNETVIERRITQPDLIFNNVREEIIHALNHDGASNDAKDGMDAILCSFDFQKMKMELVAANNPVIIIRNKELIEIKPDKFPVGLHQGELKPFTLKSFDLQKGDVIYTFTDGYPDQFGGPNAKKLMSKNFKEILLKGHMNDMSAQKENLNSIFENWRGNLEQLDDVLVIGVRV
jgi:serine phosphatase RsbU (regulator of sigma subunit)